jgi:hypothetical protein
MTIPHINNVLTMAHMIYMACGTFFWFDAMCEIWRLLKHIHHIHVSLVLRTQRGAPSWCSWFVTIP